MSSIEITCDARQGTLWPHGKERRGVKVLKDGEAVIGERADLVRMARLADKLHVLREALGGIDIKTPEGGERFKSLIKQRLGIQRVS